MPQTGQPIDAHPSFRFTVQIDNVTRAAFLECKLPNLQVETFDLKEGGQNTYIHKLPVRVNAGTVTLRHGITKDHTLLNWYVDVLEGRITDATRSVTVKIYGVDHKPISTWTFQNAYPVKWTGPALKTSENIIAVEELEFAHHGFSVET